MQAVEASAPATFSRTFYECCPLCGSRDVRAKHGADCSGHPLYRPGIPPIMTWLECVACAHVFAEGYFDEAALAFLFGRTHANQSVGHDIERQRAVSSRIVEWIADHARAGDWLDVGFGNGSLLFTAEEFGFHPVGVDLRRNNVEALRRLGYEAYCADLAELDQAGRFGVVSLADVLEHMPYPKAGLAAAHRLLKRDGVLFVSMPNSDNMVWRLLDTNEVNPYWGEIEHYHNFGRRRLYSLLETQGFRPIKYRVSERYRVCMEVLAVKEGVPADARSAADGLAHGG